MQACYRTCYQQYLIKDCGCADAQILMYGEAFDYADVDACAIDDTEQSTSPGQEYCDRMCKNYENVLYSNKSLLDVIRHV